MSQHDQADFPAVDERLVWPETRYEIIDGEVVYVPPALEPHGNRHSKLSALLEAYAAEGYDAASDMLTRTSERDDMAPDGSIYPKARHPETGGRQLEELAFEVASSETLSHAGKKAAKLCARGVRRVFAIDVERQRALEWSVQTDSWEILAPDAEIDDPAFVMPLPIAALVGAASADDAVARALLAKHNAVLVEAIALERAEGKREGKREGKLEGKREAIIAMLSARKIALSEPQRSAIMAATDEETLDRWIVGAGSCANAAELLDSP